MAAEEADVPDTATAEAEAEEEGEGGKKATSKPEQTTSKSSKKVLTNEY